jgi:hypothetical protein
MATALTTILSWFETGDFPTQQQFAATFSSFFHKDENIPQNKIANLINDLDNKAERQQLNAHLTDVNAHAALVAKARIYLPGELQIFKKTGYTTPNALEIGDNVVGNIEGTKIDGIYRGGNPLLLASYSIAIENEF